MKLTCDEAIDLFGDVEDRPEATEEQARLEQHLNQCEGCRRSFGHYRRTGKLCREALTAAIPTAAGSGLFDFLRSRLQSPSS